MSLAEPLLTNRSGAQNTSRLQEKRDQMKIANASEAEFAETLADEKRKYEEIMKKLDDFKRGRPDPNSDDHRAETSMNKATGGVELSEIKRSATSKGRTDFEPVSGRYGGENPANGAGRLTHQEAATMSQFNDEEDFRLSTDHQQSIA